MKLATRADVQAARIQLFETTHPAAPTWKSIFREKDFVLPEAKPMERTSTSSSSSSSSLSSSLSSSSVTKVKTTAKLRTTAQRSWIKEHVRQRAPSFSVSEISKRPRRQEEIASSTEKCPYVAVARRLSENQSHFNLDNANEECPFLGLLDLENPDYLLGGNVDGR